MQEAFLLDDFKAICRGVKDVAEKYRCPIVGGDMSWSSDLSISATAIGSCRADAVLLRRGAQVGDLVFVSRSVGITPAAFSWFLGEKSEELEERYEKELSSQLTTLSPMLELGKLLGESGYCTSCMDNTDGIGQTFWEIGAASNVGLEIDGSRLPIPDVVFRVSQMRLVHAYDLALAAGHDFSLVGTLRPDVDKAVLQRLEAHGLVVVGQAVEQPGIRFSNTTSRQIKASGWNYFTRTQ